jgi:large subunit ribosomal protein L30
MTKSIKVKLVHSPCGRKPDQRDTVRGLGLKHLQDEKILVDTPAVRGMIKKIPHLVAIIAEGTEK